MATCIFYEFLLGNKFEKDARYCHNALVFAPDKTVLHSLKEIESFDLTRVVPPEYVNFLTTQGCRAGPFRSNSTSCCSDAPRVGWRKLLPPGSNDEI